MNQIHSILVTIQINHRSLSFQAQPYSEQTNRKDYYEVVEEPPPPPPPDPSKQPEEKPLNTEEDAPTLNIEPMRPLLRGYCSTLTLPSRQRHHYTRLQPDGLVADYCEIAVVNGYLSDGEMVKNQLPREVSDGYVSEGGSVLYSRRMQNVANG